jgi:Pyridoxamine 5'-phosphate oxidase
MCSRKYPNLVAQPQVSLVFGWEGAETVQYEGVAQETRDTKLKERYFSVVFVAVKPTWIRYCDYALMPPRIEESRWSADSD